MSYSLRKTFGRVATAGIAVLTLSGLFTSAASEESRGSSILEPASGVLLGRFYGAGSIDQTRLKRGRTPVIHLAYYGWATDWTGSVT